MPLEAIVPSDIQALVKRLKQTRIAVRHRHLPVRRDDPQGRRPRPPHRAHPSDGIRLPKDIKAPITPMATSEIHALAEAIPQRYKAMVVLAAGTGMRRGESFGLTLDRIDFLRRTLLIDRQMTNVRGQAPTFGPPKTASSIRTIPLPDVVLQGLAEHVRHFPPGPHGVVFPGSDGQLLRRSAFGNLWRRVNKEAGVEGRTFHSLRHYYASLLIRHGESLNTVQAPPSGTPAPPRPSTPTATCGPTPTTRPARRSTTSWAARRNHRRPQPARADSQVIMVLS